MNYDSTLSQTLKNHSADLYFYRPYVSDTVYIMERGKFVESGSADKVILTPSHPYTRRLISDVPKIYEEWDLSTVQPIA